MRAAWLVSLCLLCAPLPALCEEEVDHFEAGTAALRQGSYQDAIDHLEAYADRSPSHPDASYNRGLAYVMRVKTDEQPGDLGRAAAAFEETLGLRPGDEDARIALEAIHGEIARRYARRGQDAVLARPTLDRVIYRLASERAWALGAIAASLLLALGLGLRRSKHRAVHLAGTLLWPTAALLAVVLVPLYLGARHLRLTYRPAVVVSREAFLMDAEGNALGGDPIPEAARIDVGERQGQLLQCSYGPREGWIRADAVRQLQPR